MPYALPSASPVAFVLLLGALAGAAPASAQGEASRRGRHCANGRIDTSHAATDTTVAPSDAAWTPFFQQAGVVFSIIHYRRADNRNGGVVLRLVNENDYAVRYRLRLGFLSAAAGEECWKEGRARGVIEAGRMKTGSGDGLFWIPFDGGVGIAEIRMPEHQIVPVE